MAVKLAGPGGEDAPRTADRVPALVLRLLFCSYSPAALKL